MLPGTNYKLKLHPHVTLQGSGEHVDNDGHGAGWGVSLLPPVIKRNVGLEGSHGSLSPVTCCYKEPLTISLFINSIESSLNGRQVFAPAVPMEAVSGPGSYDGE